LVLQERTSSHLIHHISEVYSYYLLYMSMYLDSKGVGEVES